MGGGHIFHMAGDTCQVVLAVFLSASVFCCYYHIPSRFQGRLSSNTAAASYHLQGAAHEQGATAECVLVWQELWIVFCKQKAHA